MRLNNGLWLFLFVFSSESVLAGAWSGYVSGEQRLFTQSPADDSQVDGGSLSFSTELEYVHDWNDGDDRIAFVPFARWDEYDAERTHMDIRELVWQHRSYDWELQTGIGKVFWGVTESQHLVDIINQTDLVENIDGEEKLGQPMVNLTLLKDWGTLDLFVLPGFRERTFPGEQGRYRPTPKIEDSGSYESGAEDKHVDYAFRWSQTFDDLDVGVSHFYGTSREPRIVPTIQSGILVLEPFYDIINQTGLDLQLTLDAWLWKLEAIHRSGQGETFNALTGGFEYTFVAINDTAVDFGLIVEYLHDDRGANPSVSFDNDIFFGGRVAMNDAASSEILLGATVDVDTDAQFYNIEASRRFGESWILSVEGRFISSSGGGDPLSIINRDDVIQFELARYF